MLAPYDSCLPTAKAYQGLCLLSISLLLIGRFNDILVSLLDGAA